MGDESYEAQFGELEDDDIEAQLLALKGGAEPESLAGALTGGSTEDDGFADSTAATTAETGATNTDSSSNQ
jgi:hypothetical protein